MDDDKADVTRCATGTAWKAYQELYAHASASARLASLEADIARLIAENTRLAASNSVLHRGMQIIAAADVPEPAKAGIPARALGRHAQRIGLLTIFS